MGGAVVARAATLVAKTGFRLTGTRRCRRDRAPVHMLAPQVPSGRVRLRRGGRRVAVRFWRYPYSIRLLMVFLFPLPSRALAGAKVCS
jgi:hypothetical protein